MDAKRISGPMSMYVGTVHDKPVYLFGDFHMRLKRKCVRCKAPACVLFPDWLDGLIKRQDKDKTLDVFVEFAIPQWGDFEYQGSNAEFLDQFYERYGKRMYHHGRKASKARFHAADPRDDPLLGSFAGFHVGAHNWNLVNCLPTATTVLQLFDTIVFAPDVSDPLPACKLNLDPYYAQPHKVAKQLNKLGDQDKKLMLEFISKYVRPGIKRMLAEEEYTKNMAIKMKHSKTAWRKSFDAVSICLGIVNARLMDIYLLARLLFYIRKSDCSACVVVAGDAHIKTYAAFFDVFFGVRLVQDHAKTCRDNDEATCIRCIDVKQGGQ